MNKLSARDKLVDNLYKLMIIVAALGVATYAWLTNSEEMSVNQLGIVTMAYTDIEMSLDNGVTWGSRLDIGIDENFTFKSDVTGSGYTLYKATLKDTNGYPISFQNAIANEDYLDFDILFRSMANVSIFLEKDSKIIPYVGTTETLLLGNSVARKSSFGNYSRDLIAGAVRVSFIEYDYNTEFVLGNNVRLTWAPNPSYEMIYDDGDYLANITSSNIQNYNYVNVIGGEPSGELRPLNLKDNISADNETKQDNGDFVISNMSSIVNDYNMAKIKIKIWIEGNDREAVVALKGGLFKIDLRFTGINKSLNNSVPSVTSNPETYTINNYLSTMEYSKDFGNNWIKYSIENNPTFKEGDIVWVRYSSTINTFASDYIELNF